MTLSLIYITSLVLTACAPAKTAAEPETDIFAATPFSPTPTYTLRPSATPSVTFTPRPTATATLEPTITPTPLPLLYFESNLTLQDMVEVFYQIGDFELLVHLLEELTDYYQQTPVALGRIYAVQGDAYTRQGDYESAAVSYTKALEILPEVQQVNGDLCRVYSLLQKPEQALLYCERAARANPSYLTYLNRGKVNASLGYLNAAVQDFEMVAKLLKFSTGADEILLVQQITGWIEALQSGNNPITPQMLAEDRQKDMAHAMPTQTMEEQTVPTSMLIQEAAAQFGFGAFKDSEIKDPFQENALPFIAASMSLGTCTAELALQSDENMIHKIMMAMRGCSYLEEYIISVRLIDLYFPGKSDKAKALVWLFKEANSVIEVEKAKAEIATVRKCNLNATYNQADQSTVLLFSCH